MGNLLFCLLQFYGNLVEQIPHGFLSVKHGSGFLIASDVILDLLLQLFVDFLIV
jgi:hypothetical protein